VKMSGKKSKNNKPNRNAEMQGKRRTKILQITFAIFCFMLVLSMILSAVSK